VHLGRIVVEVIDCDRQQVRHLPKA
jgi:hypothetical protein